VFLSDGIINISLFNVNPHRFRKSTTTRPVPSSESSGHPSDVVLHAEGLSLRGRIAGVLEGQPCGAAMRARPGFD